MDPLKIFATLESSLTADQLLAHLRTCGWSGNEHAYSLHRADCWLQLEYSGDGLYSIHGEISRTDDLEKQLQPLIEDLRQGHLHLDVFEEDGRLVKRVQI
jgi:hypothetical protein